MNQFELIKKENLKEALLAYYEDPTLFEKVNIENFKVSLNQKALLQFKEGLLKLEGKKVLIVGDYDCDGIFSTTILKSILKHLNIAHYHYIPSRSKEGYGINKEIVKRATDAQFDALITIDNGISANESLKYAKEQGLLVYVIDHHEYVDLPSETDYILHSFLLEEDYHHLCASGLAYLLSLLFFESKQLLAYAAIATYADMMEVFGFNRYLLKEGLNVLNQEKIATINAISGKKKYEYDDIQYSITPKINAFSRLNLDRDVNDLVHYFLLEDEELITLKAEVIQRVNEERKKQSESMLKDIDLTTLKGPINIMTSPHFQEGLVGLAASKITNDTQYPSLILAYNTETQTYKGSGRGIEGFDFYTYLKESNCPMTHFGGHKMAVGLTLNEEEFQNLKTYILNHPPTLKDIKKKAIVLNPEDCNGSILQFIKELEPFGTGLKKPLFYLDKPKAESVFLIKQKYPKYTFNNQFEAICFKSSEVLYEVEYFVGTIQANAYRKNGVSFQIEDFK